MEDNKKTWADVLSEYPAMTVQPVKHTFPSLHINGRLYSLDGLTEVQLPTYNVYCRSDDTSNLSLAESMWLAIYDKAVANVNKKQGTDNLSCY